MLPRRQRLVRGRDIQRVLRSGRRLRGRWMTLLFRPSSNERRCTVVVSTKVSKRATARNRLKRQVRHLLRDAWTRLPDHHDYVILLKPSSSLPTSQELSTDFQWLLSRGTNHPPSRPTRQ